jgi:uncharacterized Zn finger protein (UPF0148 family)
MMQTLVVTCPYCGHTETVTVASETWVRHDEGVALSRMQLRLAEIPYVEHDIRGCSSATA